VADYGLWSMFKDIQVTLYDIFGYLLPGSVAVAALAVLSWSIFWPSHPLVLTSTIPKVALVCLLFTMYLTGHLVQGLGNLVDSLARRWKLLDEMPISSKLADVVRSSTVSRFGSEVESMKAGELFGLCDQTLLCHGSLGDREIFMYREGFYRGNFVALTLLSIAFLFRMASRPIFVSVFGVNAELWRRHVLFAALLSGLGAVLAFRRYIRFAEHSRRACFMRFVALARANFQNQSSGKED
jgi:hypothetical protein